MEYAICFGLHHITYFVSDDPFGAIIDDTIPNDQDEYEMLEALEEEEEQAGKIW